MGNKHSQSKTTLKKHVLEISAKFPDNIPVQISKFIAKITYSGKFKGDYKYFGNFTDAIQKQLPKNLQELGFLTEFKEHDKSTLEISWRWETTTKESPQNLAQVCAQASYQMLDKTVISSANYEIMRINRSVRDYKYIKGWRNTKFTFYIPSTYVSSKIYRKIIDDHLHKLGFTNIKVWRYHRNGGVVFEIRADPICE